MTDHPLEPIFHPRGVAIVGVPSNQFGRGGGFLNAILAMGFDRNSVYPVNPKMTETSGLRCYPTLLDTPDPVDHVISQVPAHVVPELADQCIRKGVRSLHLYTAGFSETGDARMVDMEREMVAKLRAAGVRAIGPNCMGLYVPASGLAFSNGFPTEPGNVCLISQSGANASRIVGNLAARGVRFSKVISFGNGADLKAQDFFDYAASDPQTEIVIAYIEGVQGGRALLDALKLCAAAKPTIILKGGLSAAGARAASSHTGSLAGSRQIFEALCRQAGALRAETLEDLLDLTIAVRTSVRRVAGRGVALIGGPGGYAVLSSDAIAAEGLDLPPMPESVIAQLREFIPVAGTSVNNPIDAFFRTPEEFDKGMRLVAGVDQIDVVFSTSFGAMPNVQADALESMSEEELAALAAKTAQTTVEMLAQLQEETGVPFIVVQNDMDMGGGPGGGRRRPGGPGARRGARSGPAVNAEPPNPFTLMASMGAAYQQSASERGIAVFSDVRRAARTVHSLIEWRSRREGLPEIL